MNKEDKEIIEDIINSIPEEFRAIEQGVIDEKYKEYFEIDSRLEGFHTEDEILEEANKWKKSHSIQATKNLLVRLSQLPEVKSYRKIETLITEIENQNLKNFGHICLLQARMFLENSLSDKPIGMITTGLGGKENKLRYNVVLKSDKEFTESKITELEKIIKQICLKRDSELEHIENLGIFVRIMILVSIEEAIGIVIEDITDRLQFIHKEYMCTNVEIFEKEIIEQWIKGELDK